jgi:hypothetical protein
MLWGCLTPPRMERYVFISDERLSNCPITYKHITKKIILCLYVMGDVSISDGRLPYRSNIYKHINKIILSCLYMVGMGK